MNIRRPSSENGPHSIPFTEIKFSTWFMTSPLFSANFLDFLDILTVCLTNEQSYSVFVYLVFRTAHAKSELCLGQCGRTVTHDLAEYVVTGQNCLETGGEPLRARGKASLFPVPRAGSYLPESSFPTYISHFAHVYFYPFLSVITRPAQAFSPQRP